MLLLHFNQHSAVKQMGPVTTVITATGDLFEVLGTHPHCTVEFAWLYQHLLPFLSISYDVDARNDSMMPNVNPGVTARLAGNLSDNDTLLSSGRRNRVLNEVIGWLSELTYLQMVVNEDKYKGKNHPYYVNKNEIPRRT